MSLEPPVGVKSLEHIAPLLAEGITLRRQENPLPVDIYLCENIYGAAAMLKDAIVKIARRKNGSLDGTACWFRRNPASPEWFRRQAIVLALPIRSFCGGGFLS